MARNLMLLDNALNDEDGDGDNLAEELAMEFVQNHGHLIELQTQLQPHTLSELTTRLSEAESQSIMLQRPVIRELPIYPWRN